MTQDVAIPGRAAGTAQKKRRRPALIAAGAAVLLAAAYAILRAASPHAEAPAAAVVRRGDLEATVTATGKIEPRAYVDLGAQASGQLRRILVHVGDFVEQGQLLAEIDPQVQAAKVDADEAQLAQLNANLVEQQANVEYAADALERYAKLVGADSVARLTYEQGRRESKTAAAKADAIRAQILQMQSTLKADQVALGYTKIFAPMSGTVVSIDAREGQTLNATYSTPQLLRIADLSTMTVWTQVSEADVARLREGMPVYFTTLGHGDRRWAARLRQILPAPQKPDRPAGSDSNAPPPAQAGVVVLYTALFDVDNAAGDLRPEMTAQVFFIAAEARNALIVPVAALRADGGEGAARVTILDVSGGESEREVRVGLRTRFEAEVVSGLREGERVVVGRKPGAEASPLVSFRL